MLATATRTPLLTAFGPEAERIGRRCSTELSLILCDGNHAEKALAEAVRRRREGDQYLVAPLTQDSLSVLARSAARDICAQFPPGDQRRELFEALAAGVLHINGSEIKTQSIYTYQLLHTMQEFSQFGDALFVRSITERTRVEALMQRKRLYVAVAPLIDTTIPDVQSNRDARHIVIWAPNDDASDLSIYSYALWDLKLPAIFVCKGAIPGSPHHFVSPDRALDALSQAAVIVDTHGSDPGSAIAFAGRGFGLATAVASGAHEYIQGIATYDMHNFQSISGAVSRARADRRAFTLPMVDATSSIKATIKAAQPIIPDNPPLVSIVIPTYNRREEIRKHLTSMAKQTYPNIEVLVVNDCGEDISDVVKDFPFARYLTTPTNVGCAGACNVGLRASRGEFVGCIGDDDRDYPAHVANLVSALVSSNGDIAHGDIVLRLDTTLPDGTRATCGHLLEHDGDLDTWFVHWGMNIHAQGYLIRRSVYEPLGFLDDSLVCANDLELSLRLSKHFDFAHVTSVSGEMAYRDDKSNLSSSIGDGLAIEINKVLTLNAPPESELIKNRISQMVTFVHAASQQPTFFYPWIRLDPPIALP